MKTVSTKVLVVGAGPTGLTAATILAQAGIPTITLSRYGEPAQQPRASFTNQRTMEVFRDLGAEDGMIAVATQGSRIGHNVMATSLTGQEILRYQTYGTGERIADYQQASPSEYCNLPQHVMEPVLLRVALSHGADVRYGHEMVAIEQNEREVIARVKDRRTDEEYLIRADFAVGADGGRSRVAEQIGIPFEGQASLLHMLNAWIEADLEPYVAHRPAGLYMVFQPGGKSWVGSGTFSHVGKFNDWILSREYDPKDGEPDTSDAAITEAARTLSGVADLEVRVKGTYKWQVNNQVATRFRQGRVFLAGDAAHRHSPAGGLGSNTCIQDAYNLAWKLAFVLKGKAGERLLESYDQERQPVGKQIVDRAMVNLQNKSAIGEALGIRRGQSAEEGWAALSFIFSDEPGAAERREALENVRALQHARSNAHGVALGQHYISCAVVDDGTSFPEPLRDPIVYYQPTTHPGAYLPHAWVEHKRRRLSTLDLAGHGGFCLIVGIGGSPWVTAAAAVSAELGIDLPVYSVGYRCEYDDPLGTWTRLRETDDRGALLVRPDRHIAWRAATRSESPREALASALRQALALG